jgi:hypothetical protein
MGRLEKDRVEAAEQAVVGERHLRSTVYKGMGVLPSETISMCAERTEREGRKRKALYDVESLGRDGN